MFNLSLLCVLPVFTNVRSEVTEMTHFTYIPHMTFNYIMTWWK